MELIASSYLINVLYVICSIFIIFYLYMTRHFNYWNNKNVPYIKPIPIFGNALNIFLLKSSIGHLCAEVYKSSKEAFTGLFIFDEPYLLVRDSEMIKSILIKDFETFNNRTMTDNKKADPMGSNILFVGKNPEAREVRRRMTPAFSSGKLKQLHVLMLKVAEDLLMYTDKLVGKENVLEARELCAKYTTDVITSTSFGLEGHSFESEDAPFRVIARRIYNWQMFWHALQTTCYFVAPKLVQIFGMRFIDKFSTDYLTKVFWEVINERERSKTVRNDLIDILIGIRKENALHSFKLDGDILVAQATQFFIAGYETTSSTMSFALYEFAKNLDIQEKARQESRLLKAKYSGLNYEAIQEMKYLDMCIKETLRLYPIVPFLDRRSAADYRIPGTKVVLEKGRGIYIPTWGIQMDAQYYPDPTKFNPERFTEENIAARPPYTFLPFGDGPRNCIGSRYSYLSAKTGLANLLDNYEVRLCSKTQETMVCHPFGFLLQPETGQIFLNFVKLQN